MPGWGGGIASYLGAVVKPRLFRPSFVPYLPPFPPYPSLFLSMLPLHPAKTYIVCYTEVSIFLVEGSLFLFLYMYNKNWDLLYYVVLMCPCYFFVLILVFNVCSVFQFPMTAYIVAGTQAAPGKQNHVIVMKMSQLDKTISNEEESEGLTFFEINIIFPLFYSMPSFKQMPFGIFYYNKFFFQSLNVIVISNSCHYPYHHHYLSHRAVFILG